MTPSASTVSRSDTASGTALGTARHPVLFVALSCERPSERGEALSLTGADTVLLGRAGERTLREEGGTLQLGFPDPRMSSRHAQLTRVLDRWVIQDLGSKNGVRVNGAPQQRAALNPGDVFELGHTFFLFGEADAPPRPPRASPLAPTLVTWNPALARTFDDLGQVARSAVPVLIHGETGTGKELAARAVHALSGRTGALVAVNCGALSETLAESELFGHRKGAFTGATEDRPGLIRASHRGTLLLDEIGDLPPSLQAALLRVLQESEVLPVGSSQPVKVDLRVVAATHRDLAVEVSRGRFRADLLARLSGYVARLPPLRERRADLSLLIPTLLARTGTNARASFAPDAARALLLHDFPGNIRELEKALAVASVLARDGRIERDHLPESLRGGGVSIAPTSAVLDDASRERREQLRELLRVHRGNVTVIARELGVARMQVQRWLKRFSLDAAAFRAPSPP